MANRHLTRWALGPEQAVSLSSSEPAVFLLLKAQRDTRTAQHSTQNTHKQVAHSTTTHSGVYLLAPCTHPEALG